jgi:SpoVK/Ycf46/Vps4 family AAA+-type ATPase
LTEGFTGADLAAILTDAGLAAIHEVLDSREDGIPEGEPCISKELLMSVAMKARPSTPVDDKRGYDKEFGEFVSSRKSISTKVLLRTQFHSIQSAYFTIEYSSVPIRPMFTCNSCLSSGFSWTITERMLCRLENLKERRSRWLEYLLQC